MVRPTDRPLRNVRVSFEVTRFSTQSLIDAYQRLAPMVRRVRRQTACAEASPREIKPMAVKTRRSEA
jgi:hypothetical protein